MDIQNKLIVTRAEVEEENNEEKKGKGHQGSCIKDPWTKTTEGKD